MPHRANGNPRRRSLSILLATYEVVLEQRPNAMLRLTYPYLPLSLGILLSVACKT